ATATALPPVCATVSSAPRAFTSAATTLAPSRTNVCAATRPIPPPAPVISATLPSSRPISPPLTTGGASPARASCQTVGRSDARWLGLRRLHPLADAGLAIDGASFHLGFQTLHLVFRTHRDGTAVMVLSPEQVVEPAYDQED